MGITDAEFPAVSVIDREILPLVVVVVPVVPPVPLPEPDPPSGDPAEPLPPPQAATIAKSKADISNVQ